MMSVKLFILALFLIIVASLGSALYHLVTNKSQERSQKIAKALTLRIGLSLVLFILVIIALATGLIQPEGIGARMHINRQLDQAPRE